VAKVAAVQRRVESGFARISLLPVANPDGVRHVLVLEPLNVQMPPRPAQAAETPKPERSLNAPGRKSASTP
jgi:rod shape-determining protein MreC